MVVLSVVTAGAIHARGHVTTSPLVGWPRLDPSSLQDLFLLQASYSTIIQSIHHLAYGS